ncbi:MAG: DedA family protein [Candidatus Aenigmarchaeota archaeon]|nr:DedA family protein [Candidatus Aenigmarchaeota archaeon]
MVLVELLVGVVTGVISQVGYVGIFLLMLLESALIPVPSEVIMPFSGFLVASGELNLYYVIAAGTLGNLAGSLIAYFLGSFLGRRLVLRYGRYILIDESHLDLADKWFRKFGSKIIFLSRNLPAVRTYISLPAGITKMNPLKFSFFTLFGSLPWNIILTYIGVILGRNWNAILRYTTFLDIAVIAGVIVLIAWYLRKRI